MNNVKLTLAKLDLRIGNRIQYKTSEVTDEPETIVNIRMTNKGVKVITEDSQALPCTYTIDQLDNDFLAGRMLKLS